MMTAEQTEADNGQNEMGTGAEAYSNLGEAGAPNEKVESEPVLDEKLSYSRLANEYIQKIDEQIMGDYEALGAYKFVAQVSPDEVGEYWDRFNGQVEAHGVFAPDGTHIGYKIYQKFPDVIAEKRDECMKVSAKSNELSGRKDQAVAEQETEILDHEVTAGSAEFAGEMSYDEFADYVHKNPGVQTRRTLMYGREGRLITGKARVYRILG